MHAPAFRRGVGSRQRRRHRRAGDRQRGGGGRSGSTTPSRRAPTHLDRPRPRLRPAAAPALCPRLLAMLPTGSSTAGATATAAAGTLRSLLPGSGCPLCHPSPCCRSRWNASATSWGGHLLRAVELPGEERDQVAEPGVHRGVHRRLRLRLARRRHLWGVPPPSGGPKGRCEVLNLGGVFPEGEQRGRVRRTLGEGGRNSRRQGCLGRRFSPGTWNFLDLCPPRAPLAPCFHPPETLRWFPRCPSFSSGGGKLKANGSSSR